jgi:hypothetical protein
VDNATRKVPDGPSSAVGSSGSSACVSVVLLTGSSSPVLSAVFWVLVSADVQATTRNIRIASKTNILVNRFSDIFLRSLFFYLISSVDRFEPFRIFLEFRSFRSGFLI